MPALVEPALDEQLEERPVGSGEADVRASDGSEAVGRLLEPLQLGRELGVEELVGVHRDRGKKVVAVGKMRVRGADGDAEAPAGLGEREVANTTLRDEVSRGVDQRRPQVPVVVAATLGLRRQLNPGIS